MEILDLSEFNNSNFFYLFNHLTEPIAFKFKEINLTYIYPDD